MARTKKEYREFVLDNGLNVAIQNTPTNTVSAKLNVWHGARNEKKGEEGLAHLVEHSLMRGSKNYSSEESDKIWSDFGLSDAYTGPKKTSFEVDMLSEDSKLFIEYISDTAFNPIFKKSNVDEERQIVLRETEEEANTPGSDNLQKYREALFGRNSPHARSTLGKEEVVKNTSLDSIRKFHKRGYFPNNMDLIMVGGLPKNIESIIENNFRKYSPGEIERVSISPMRPLKRSTILHTSAPERYNQENPLVSNAEAVISLFAPAAFKEDQYAVQVLTNFLRGGLFQVLRQEKGLAYNVGVKYSKSSEWGAIDISSNIPATRLNEGIETIFDVMNALKEYPVRKESLNRLVKGYTYDAEKKYESNIGKRDAIELEICEGISPLDHLERIKSVTPEIVMEAAIKYLPKNQEEGKYVLWIRDPLKKD